MSSSRGPDYDIGRRWMNDARLVWRQHEDVYESTTSGQQYLEGEMDAENQPRPRPNRVS